VRQNDLATLFPGGDQGTVRITRLRADLNQAALATDLVLQASSDQSDVSNFYQISQSVNAPACPAVPNPCPPCDTSSSGGGDGGVVGSLGGGSKTSAASPGQQSFGCSAAPSDGGGGGWLEMTLAGLLGLAIVRGRARRKR
jgi:MYXO-CTERM domain-containing protein